MMNGSFKGAIFDLDGTLLDSMEVWDAAGERYLAALGIDPESGIRQDVKTMSLAQAAEYFKTRYALPLTIGEIMEGINKVIEDFYFYQVQLKPGVRDFLEKLDDRGVKMAIATATDRYQVEAALKRCGVVEFFEAIVTCSEVGHGKDEPVVFDAAMEILADCGVRKSETVVFEDAAHALETAKGAGYICAGVYDRFEDRQDKVRALSDYYIEDFAEAEGVFL